MLWLLPAGGIFLFSHGTIDAHVLSLMTLSVLALSNVLDAFGSASWMSWMAVLVPPKVRGRYFSLRRSLASLTALLTIPLGGWLVSQWMGGDIEGYGIVLIIAVLMGMVSLGFQFNMSDVNPQAVVAKAVSRSVRAGHGNVASTSLSLLRSEKRDELGLLGHKNFLILLLFLGLWSCGVNLSAPFFNFYLLDNLQVDVRWVALYSSLRYGAFFLAMLLWGRLADRIGNRPVLLMNGLLAASVPLLWMHVDSSFVSLWVALPLLHILEGAMFAALDLCLANIQLELAPWAKQSSYFAIAAAIMGGYWRPGYDSGRLFG